MTDGLAGMLAAQWQHAVASRAKDHSNAVWGKRVNGGAEKAMVQAGEDFRLSVSPCVANACLFLQMQLLQL